MATAANESWYEQVQSETPITQGDIISNCPLIGWKDEELDLRRVDAIEILKGATVAIRADVVVMTQACDLAHDKVRQVILCPHLSLAEFKAEWEAAARNRNENPTAKAWKTYCDDVCDGYVWNLTMLNAEKTANWSIEPRIVDFHEIFSVPKSFLESLVRQRAEPRLRLRPPYREHLSQAFARYFMRVGLPVNIARAWR